MSKRRPAPERPAQPVLVLPPARPGGPPRRFVVRPGRVYALLLLVFLCGAGISAGAAWRFLPRPVPGLQSANLALTSQLTALKARIAELEGKLTAPPTEEPAAATGPVLSLALSGLGDAEPAVRVALLRTKEPVEMRGEGLVLEHEGGKSTPMQGRVLARPGDYGVFVEGVGTIKDGTRVVNRLGPIRIGKHEYPGSLELHRVDGRVLLINELPLERYLQGVVSSELPASWHLEAKKAQTVAARTYALMQVAQAEGPFHLEATVDDQVYSGKAADATSRAAVAATHGEVLAADGYLVSAWYHSTCGGRTETAHAVWPDRPSRGIAPAECGFCQRAPSFSWTVDISVDELLEAARKDGHDATAVNGLHVRSRTSTDRLATVELETDTGPVLWTGNRFRELLGWTKVRSTRFEHSVQGRGFRLTGGGLGHGVGLCQWGAQGMAKAGEDYRAVLGRYYPTARIQRLY